MKNLEIINSFGVGVNIKKYMIGAGVIVMVLGVAGSLVLAEEIIDQKNSKTALTATAHPRPMIVEIGPVGRTLLRGTISAVGSNSITVKSWGGDWTVNILTDTKLLPGTDMSQFKAGDFVGMHGFVNQSAAWTIDATLVRNWTVKKAEKEDEKENKESIKKERKNNQEEIKEVIKNERPKNWQGTASNISASDMSFTLTIDGVAYSVKVVTDAKIVNKNFLIAGFADIKDGHTVRVWGPVSGTTISAYVVRDVSILPSVR